MESKKIPAVAVVGPTASGKTALSVELALKIGGEIISADSMQIFKNMPIASAVPSVKERKGVYHYLMEILDNDCTFSVSDFVKMANAAAAEIHKKGKTPILTGGTGLYIDAFINNYSFSNSTPDGALRELLSQEYDRLGGENMLERLRAVDKQTAERLHPNDKKRIVRAFEVYELSKNTLTQQNEQSRINPSPYSFCIIGLAYRDRQLLYDRINKRVDIMLENGLLEEAHKAFLQNAKGTGTQAIGHKELFGYFEGTATKEEAVEKIKMQTRRYAKRQMTWFNKNQNINWIYIDECDDAVSAAYDIIEQNGLV